MSTRLYNNRYTIVEEIDATPFTRVYKAQVVDGNHPGATGTQTTQMEEETKTSQEKTTGNFVALKKLKNTRGFENISLDTLREVKVLKGLDHPHIIKLLDTFVDKQTTTYQKESTFLVMEFMKLDLHNLIHSDSFTFTKADIKSIMHQILSGLACLHKNQIIHRDIKPANILLAEDGTAKISDFGSARLGNFDEGNMTPRVTTRYYRSPEILYGAKTYGPTVDTWAAGCTMAEMLLGKHFFPGHSEIDELTKIFSIRGTPTEETCPGLSELPCYIPFEPVKKVSLDTIFHNVSQETIDLLERLLELDPKKRITSQEALEHPYFTTGSSINESTYQEYIKTYVPKKKQSEH